MQGITARFLQPASLQADRRIPVSIIHPEKKKLNLIYGV